MNFHGMELVEDARLPKHQYTLTDKRGVVLAGGDLEQGLQWKAKRRGPRGDAARIHASPDAYKRLMAEKSAGVKPEVPDVDRNAS